MLTALSSCMGYKSVAKYCMANVYTSLSNTIWYTDKCSITTGSTAVTYQVYATALGNATAAGNIYSGPPEIGANETKQIYVGVGNYITVTGSNYTAQEIGGQTSAQAGTGNFTEQFIPAPVPVVISGSAQFSGSNSLSAPNSAALNPGTGNFTVEFWTRLTSTTNNASFYRGSNSGVDIFMNGASRLSFGQAGISTLIVDTVTMTTGSWVHVAAVKIGGVIRLYKNGVQVGSAGDGSNYTTSTTTTIGTQGTWNITGYMSNLRVVIGLGVYTGAFTPPTSPLTVTQSAGTNISAITAGQTQLLLNTVNGADFLVDSSTNAITITNTGAVTSSALNPF